METPEDTKKRHYKFGMFYHNSDDEKIFIPKNDGLGWTLNFANNWSYVILFLIIAFTVTISVLAARQKS